MYNNFSTRLKILRITFLLIGAFFAWRLFDLQVINYEKYYQEARAQHDKRSILPARRGNILVRKNYFSEEHIPLATNNTLKMLFVDPVVLSYPKYNPQLPLEAQEKGNPEQVAALLAPILIHSHCESIEGCQIEMNPEKWSAEEKIAIEAYQIELSKLFNQVERTRVVLETELAGNRIARIKNLNLPGIFIEGKTVIADPTRILDLKTTAEKCSKVLNMETEKLMELLTRRANRYTEITHKIVPEVSERILELKENSQYKLLLRGIQLQDEHWRYYPEKSLAAQVLGFVDNQNIGQYGIEGRFDLELKGESGFIYGATNTRGQRILGKDSQIKQAKDGADILLSIDRIIQGKIEKFLEEDTERFQADFGQAIVVEPKTGKILAMAHFPNFNPNEYGKVFLKYEIQPEQYQLDLDDKTFNQRIPTISVDGKLYRYFNVWGPQVFRNKVVSDSYEPGSVMKAITMAGAINSNEVTPSTLYQDTGPIEVDNFKIRNADGIYAGPTSMVSVLNRSLNTGIAFITRKMGKKLVYEYLHNFGFGQYTDIELPGEEEGSLRFWKDWAESELITNGFGQGLLVTPLQMAMAFCALANGGYLMKPIIVEEIQYKDGTPTKKFIPEILRKTISDKTYNTIKSMLLNVINSKGGSLARVAGYSVMGKTGTAQTYQNGKAMEGLGTTIASFVGFAPLQEPKFVVLVKYDYPRTSQWGSETAAITARHIMEFLFNYFEIPPDK